jgi:Capsular polysaccharide synthesis protein/Polysaccharide pyruvyl transferase
MTPKIIWCLWLQGRENAPDLVKRCLGTWERLNPGWELRCLDATTVGRYVDITRYVDLSAQEVTAASLSDIVRMLLLHEYGGVWIDATLYCNQPLDEWLPGPFGNGFFGFYRPAPERLIGTWFLAAAPGNVLLEKWATRALNYWRGRPKSTDYFWVHHQFNELIATDPEARRDWEAVPRISADGPRSVLECMYESFSTGVRRIDWASPVFKLTHRINESANRPDSVLNMFMSKAPLPDAPVTPSAGESPREAPTHFAGIKVKTENLGDHVQILAANQLLQRVGIQPDVLLDRDDEIASAQAIAPLPKPVGALINGWYKTNPVEWPPHPDLDPIYLGFHMRLFQSPTLVSPEAIAHYKKFEPVGCRDAYTSATLRAHGVNAFVSYCLSMLYEKRMPSPLQTETYVVSRTEDLLRYVPSELGDVHYVSHYSGSSNFHDNMLRVGRLLELYRTRAKLIVTSLLHCALPAVAMGIPVVIFYPPNPPQLQTSDRERFSSLERLIRVFALDDIGEVDWRGYVADVSHVKLALLDRFYTAVRRWNLPSAKTLGPVAPATALQLPPSSQVERALFEAERVEVLRETTSESVQRWGAPSSYNKQPAWVERAQMVSALIPNGASILEVGVGKGDFRRFISDRALHVGVDLNPLDADTIAVDLDSDPLPPGHFAYAVLLGVLEYVQRPELAARKISDSAEHVVITYCCRTDASPEGAQERLNRAWINDYTEPEFVALFASLGKPLVSRAIFQKSPHFEQVIFKFGPGR